MGAFHCWLCSKPRVNDIAVGIAMMLFGTGLAFFIGKPLVQPKAPQLQSFELGAFSDVPGIRNALSVNPLFLVGVALAIFLAWALKNSRWGLVLRMVGESSDAARALGYSVETVRLLATAAGGGFAGVAGSFLSLSYPGIWSEGLSSGQGLIAVALVIFARWDPIKCLYASLLYGAASSLSSALQSIHVEVSTHLLNTAPALMTLIILVWTSHPSKSISGAPAELTIG
jgi:simple sugar transport system permease protein